MHVCVCVFLSHMLKCFVTLLSVELKHTNLAKDMPQQVLFASQWTCLFEKCVDQTLVMVNFMSSALWLVTFAQRHGCS